MLTKQNVFEVSRQGYALMSSDKWKVSRALRRFIQSVDEPACVKDGERAIYQSLAFDEGHTLQQLDALERYASNLVEKQQGFLPENAFQFEGVVRDDMFRTVFCNYSFPRNPTAATLEELQKMVKVIIVLADSMHQYAANPNEEALSECPAYHYRNYPCSIQPEEELWAVSGQDQAHGSSGVLEWCYDETDATAILEKMNRFPERFTNLKAEPFLSAFATQREALAA